MDFTILIEDARWPSLPDLNKLQEVTLKEVSWKPVTQVNLVLGNDVMIRSLNAQYREKDAATNVLSFPLWTIEELNSWWKEKEQEVMLGDIVLALETVQKEAMYSNFDHHVYHLVTHGLLHLLGYDHINDKDAEIMENHEVRILEAFHIPNPYLI